MHASMRMHYGRKYLLKSLDINEFLIGCPTPPRADSPNELNRNPWPLLANTVDSMTLPLQDDAAPCIIRHLVGIRFIPPSYCCIDQRRHNKQSLSHAEIFQDLNHTPNPSGMPDGTDVSQAPAHQRTYTGHFRRHRHGLPSQCTALT